LYNIKFVLSIDHQDRVEETNPLFTHYCIVNRNSTNKMAPLLRFVNRRPHIDVKLQRMTMSCDQSSILHLTGNIISSIISYIISI